MAFAPLEPSLWFATASPAPETGALESAISADVCIIGAGYTGLSSAIHLAEKGTAVVVLEANVIGFGGSGRNAGHCTPTFHHHSLAGVRKILGEPFGTRFIAAQANAADLVFGLIDRYGIDCDAVRTGYVEAAHTPAVFARIDAKNADYMALGKRTQVLTKAETERRTGSQRYFGGWLHPDGGHLNPLSYVRGLARALLGLGGRIYTQSTVISIKPAGTRWQVSTSRGSVTVDKVVLASGAYSTAYWPGIDRTFARLATAAFATEPLSPELIESIVPENNTVVETRSDPASYRITADGRLVTTMMVEGRRGGNVDYTRMIASRRFEWILPQLRGKRWEYYWYGELDMHSRTFPRLYDVAPGIAAATGFSGRGVPTGTAVGEILADWAFGISRKDLAMPMDPLTTVSPLLNLATRVALPYVRLVDQMSAWRYGIRPPKY
ncbi:MULTISPECIES: NAD(P)/FAD-dependent oxidoreductase [Alphaproteobacteria]|uniref:Oxidoreductase n=2 Tax=Alphaproteobacteria TaxID=28211 RepID=A0A512HPJ8_9HYPH|nr:MULTISPECIES: FAD-binding oxidoreductase [Alphaproteobacteria]GEO87383.1 oxidoreductase [Ciceribacter naphthalenivorans]GLR23102.1 oxidoreductase [Ciceribacter naphthalenivorans]GLT05958.1 oxidoreductase [Sphingomonas psychrolutea]